MLCAVYKHTEPYSRWHRLLKGPLRPFKALRLPEVCIRPSWSSLDVSGGFLDCLGAALGSSLKKFDFSGFCDIQCLGLSWVLVMLCCALLEPKKDPRQPRRTPGEPQQPPRRAQESPRGSQRLSVSSLEALLELSWGSFEQCSCSTNLSLTEAKPRTAKIMDLEYEISIEVSSEKTIEFLFKTAHHSRTRAPKCIGRSHFSTLKTSQTVVKQIQCLRKH